MPALWTPIFSDACIARAACNHSVTGLSTAFFRYDAIVVAHRHVWGFEFMLSLLDLTVEIAKVGNDRSWGTVAKSLQSHFPCMEFDTRNCEHITAENLLASIQRCHDSPGCGRGAWCLHSEKPRVLSALATHIEKASLPERVERRMKDSALAALDTITRPMLIVENDLTLVFANLFAEELIRVGQWMVRSGGLLKFYSSWFQARVVRQFALVKLHQFQDVQQQFLPMQLPNGERAELWMRQLSRPGDPVDNYLLSVTGISSNENAKLVLDHSLTPRQSELANHLLRGIALGSAAALMGISRNTAKDHLAGLFKLSNTSRQVDLIAWLTRQAIS